MLLGLTELLIKLVSELLFTAILKSIVLLLFSITFLWEKVPSFSATDEFVAFERALFSTD